MRMEFGLVLIGLRDKKVRLEKIFLQVEKTRTGVRKTFEILLFENKEY